MQTEKSPAANTGPQVKICGLTRSDQALDCARLGADAIGLVFYPRSPRNVTLQQAGDICRRLPPGVAAVGVFVDRPSAEIITLADRCGFSTVQLHGQEKPRQITRLKQAGLKVVKALFTNRSPEIGQAPRYGAAAAILVECGQGKLPGGNALAWNWKLPGGLFQKHPVILAGGLDPENIRKALLSGRPDAFDVSTGVEISPGNKDMRKVQAFMAAVTAAAGSDRFTNSRPLKRVF